ncbi:MAG: hypothetical protein NTZ59_12975, partial [Bacteroidetes bacterium]|nr:hypothetical protein [Bacteroidota bacterium]
PQQIKLPGLTINSYADKVNYIKNGSEQTLTGENVYGPKLFLNPSKSKLLIAYYTSAGTDGKIALQVYDLAGIRKIGNAITFEGKFQKYTQPLGFGLSDDEIVFTEFSAKSFSNRIEIVVYNYNIGKEVKRIKSEKLSGGFLGFRDEFQYNKIINSRFVMGVSTYKDFYQLIDLQTEQSVVLPKIIIDDCLNYGGAKSDTILVLGTSPNMIYNSIITFNNLYKHFTKDEIKNFNTNKIKNDVYLKSLGNFTKLLIGVFYVDSLSGPSEKKLEDCFVNKVYSENNSENKFFKGDRDPTFVGADGPRARINCPYDLMLFNSISLTKTNTYFKTRQIEETDKNKIIGIIDDKLYAYGFIENKLVSDKYQLDYYPLRIIDAQKEYVTIFGIDKYAFPIIKKYDIKKIFEKYTSSIAVTEIKSKTSNETTIPVTKKSTETSKKSSKASLGCKNYTSDDVDLWREKNAVEIKYLEMVNTTKKALKLEFYHPDSKSKFSDFYINPGQRVYFLSEGLKVGIGNDWGIKLASNKNKNCIYFLGDLVTVRDTDFILDVSKIPGD